MVFRRFTQPKPSGKATVPTPENPSAEFRDPNIASYGVGMDVTLCPKAQHLRDTLVNGFDMQRATFIRTGEPLPVLPPVSLNTHYNISIDDSQADGYANRLPVTMLDTRQGG